MHNSNSQKKLIVHKIVTTLLNLEQEKSPKILFKKK